MNHYEVQVSTNQIDVYGTNAVHAGTPEPGHTPLVHIATIPNANLSFTRGLVWIEDAHYNGDKFGPSACTPSSGTTSALTGLYCPETWPSTCRTTRPPTDINFTGIPAQTSGIDLPSANSS